MLLVLPQGELHTSQLGVTSVDVSPLFSLSMAKSEGLEAQTNVS